MTDRREEEIYRAAHEAALSGALGVLKTTRSTAEEVAAFSGAVAALFALMVEGWVSKGVVRDEAVAKAQFWLTGYATHLAAQPAKTTH